MKTHRVQVLVLLAPFLAACGDPPTKEEAGAALGETKSLSKIEFLGGAPAPAPAPKPASSRREEVFPPLSGTGTVDAMKCDRVSRSTYDCSVTWRFRYETTPTSGRYRFIRAPDGKWTATSLDPRK